MAVGSAVLALLIALVPGAVLWLLRGDLPDRVAVHWGVDGQPDGWASVGTAILSGVLIGAAISLLLVAVGAFMKAMRVMGPMAVGAAAFGAILLQGSVLLQRDGAEPKLGFLLFVALLAWLVIGIVGWRFLRDRIVPVPPTETGTFVPSPPGHPDVRTWSGRLRGGNGIVILAALVAVTGVVLSLWLGASDPWMMASLLLLTVGVALLMLLSVRQVVEIDEQGIRVTAFGLTLERIPLTQLRSAGRIEVEALGDFGGYGRRVGLDGKREGLVTSSGEALIVERDGQKDLVFTVDDAHTAASVLAMHLAED